MRGIYVPHFLQKCSVVAPHKINVQPFLASARVQFKQQKINLILTQPTPCNN